MKPQDRATGGGGPRGRGARCPICGKARDRDHRPFCSRRCADIDLGRWLGERYVVPGEPVRDDGGAQED